MSNTHTPPCRSHPLRCSILILLLGACFALGTPPELHAAAEPALTRGPYLQMGTSSSMVVRWRTSISTDSRVCFGTDPDNLSRCIDLGNKTTEHIVALSGLTSDTRYYYSVGTTIQRLAGGDANHFFVSSPASGTAQPTRIWVIGDSGTADAGARAVRDYILGGADAGAVVSEAKEDNNIQFRALSIN